MNFVDNNNLSAEEMIEKLKNHYKDDVDALESIDRAKQNVEYIKKQMKNNPDYTGQTPEQHIIELSAMLELWH